MKAPRITLTSKSWESLVHICCDLHFPGDKAVWMKSFGFLSVLRQPNLWASSFEGNRLMEVMPPLRS